MEPDIIYLCCSGLLKWICLFCVSGETSVLHSAEFDDGSMNLAEDNSRMAVGCHRFVSRNVYF